MRIDLYLKDKYGSRTKAAEAVSAELVKVNGKSVAPSYELKEGDALSFLTPDEKYVSNGGYKLSKALKDFSFSVKGKVIADIGASNGGFTDCLFQNGAKKVYCIDVGESQLDASLLNKNIVVVDNYNARNLSQEIFEENIDGVVIDVSFISLTYILNNVADILKSSGFVIALIKPQFECESRGVGKNGIVRSAATRKNIVKKIYDYAIECNLIPQKLTTAPIKSGKNIEYLILLEKDAKNRTSFNHLYIV